VGHFVRDNTTTNPLFAENNFTEPTPFFPQRTTRVESVSPAKAHQARLFVAIQLHCLEGLEYLHPEESIRDSQGELAVDVFVFLSHFIFPSKFSCHSRQASFASVLRSSPLIIDSPQGFLIASDLVCHQ
jgi:hypothetical protein